MGRRSECVNIVLDRWALTRAVTRTVVYLGGGGGGGCIQSKPIFFSFTFWGKHTENTRKHTVRSENGHSFSLNSSLI